MDFLLRRAARMAASLTRLARSAPVNPGERRASASMSTSCRHRGAGAPLAGILRRRPGQPCQRGGDPGRAPQQEDHRRIRVQRGDRPRDRRPGAAQPDHLRGGEGDHRLPRGRSRRRAARAPQVRSGDQGDHRQPRHGARLHDEPAAEDRYLHSKTEFEDKIAGMLGGNVAETIVFGDTTTGSSNDIEKATSLARAMVTQYGMSEKLGPLAFGKKEEMVFLGRDERAAQLLGRGRRKDRRRGARDHRPRLQPRPGRPLAHEGCWTSSPSVVEKETIERRSSRRSSRASCRRERSQPPGASKIIPNDAPTAGPGTWRRSRSATSLPPSVAGALLRSPPNRRPFPLEARPRRRASCYPIAFGPWGSVKGWRFTDR